MSTFLIKTKNSFLTNGVTILNGYLRDSTTEWDTWAVLGPGSNLTTLVLTYLYSDQLTEGPSGIQLFHSRLGMFLGHSN